MHAWVRQCVTNAPFVDKLGPQSSPAQRSGRFGAGLAIDGGQDRRSRQSAARTHRREVSRVRGLDQAHSVIGADDNRLAAWIAPERLLDPHRWKAIARPRRAGTRGRVQQREGGEAVPAVKNGAKALRRERREPLAEARVVEEGGR